MRAQGRHTVLPGAEAEVTCQPARQQRMSQRTGLLPQHETGRTQIRQGDAAVRGWPRVVLARTGCPTFKLYLAAAGCEARDKSFAREISLAPNGVRHLPHRLCWDSSRPSGDRCPAPARILGLANGAEKPAASCQRQCCPLGVRRRLFHPFFTIVFEHGFHGGGDVCQTCFAGAALTVGAFDFQTPAHVPVAILENDRRKTRFHGSNLRGERCGCNSENGLAPARP